MQAMAESPTRRPGNWWRVAPEVTAQRRETGRRVAAIVALARGDPRLSAWEEGFLTSLADILRRTNGHIELSEKQAMALLRIQDKVSGQLAILAEAGEDAAGAAEPPGR
jgi:hypothetical protein